jgi:hypothetical protein
LIALARATEGTRPQSYSGASGETEGPKAAMWVNLLLFIPPILFIAWRSRGLQISRRQLLFATLFALAFGFVEAVVVVYLLAAAALLPGYIQEHCQKCSA